MSLGQRVDSDHQLARLLQIGVVLEEVVESRAKHHVDSLSAELDADVRQLLQEAADESAAHRKRLESLIDELNAETVGYEEINALVEAKYGQTGPEDFDGVLYDQLCNEETTYKFYDDLIEAVEASDANFSVDTDELLTTLETLREEEAAGVEAVTQVMEDRE